MPPIAVLMDSGTTAALLPWQLWGAFSVDLALAIRQVPQTAAVSVGGWEALIMLTLIAHACGPSLRLHDMPCSMISQALFLSSASSLSYAT